jgi:hypothetical protein
MLGSDNILLWIKLDTEIKDYDRYSFIPDYISLFVCLIIGISASLSP